MRANLGDFVELAEHGAVVLRVQVRHNRRSNARDGGANDREAL
jgi:hypothetical protein